LQHGWAVTEALGDSLKENDWIGFWHVSGHLLQEENPLRRMSQIAGPYCFSQLPSLVRRSMVNPAFLAAEGDMGLVILGTEMLSAQTRSTGRPHFGHSECGDSAGD
jgi:hypothetical protein